MRRNSIITIIVGLIILFIVFNLLKNEDRTILNFITLFGSYASLIGVVIAYQQILSIKKTAQLTKDAVDRNSENIKRVLSISDISKATKVVEQIQSFIRTTKFEPAFLRMQDLKYILIQADNIEELKDFTSNEKYTQIISLITSDLKNMAEFLRDGRKKIDFTIVNSNLEEIGTILVRFENKLKSKNI